MNPLRILLLAILAPATLVPLGCKKRYEPRAVEWRIEPGKTLGIEAQIRGNLTIHSELYKGAISEVITYGVQSSGEASVKRLSSGAWFVKAENAELYIADNQRLELLGSVGGVIQMLNHKAHVEIKGKDLHDVRIRNAEGGIRIQDGLDVKVGNLKGDLELIGAGYGGGRIEASSIEGSVHATDIGSHLSLNYVTGDCIARGLQLGAFLYGLNGTTSVSCQGDLELYAFDDPMRRRVLSKWRQDVEKALASQGKDISIRSLGRATVSGIAARNLRIEASTIALSESAALKADLVGAALCSVSLFDGPLRLTQCSNGVLYFTGDYELTRCSGLSVEHWTFSDRAPGRGVLKDCQEIVFWGIPSMTVTKQNCQDVIFSR